MRFSARQVCKDPAKVKKRREALSSEEFAASQQTQYSQVAPFDSGGGYGDDVDPADLIAQDDHPAIVTSGLALLQQEREQGLSGISRPKASSTAFRPPAPARASDRSLPTLLPGGPLPPRPTVPLKRLNTFGDTPAVGGLHLELPPHLLELEPEPEPVLQSRSPLVAGPTVSKRSRLAGTASVGDMLPPARPTIGISRSASAPGRLSVAFARCASDKASRLSVPAAAGLGPQRVPTHNSFKTPFKRVTSAPANAFGAFKPPSAVASASGTAFSSTTSSQDEPPVAGPSRRIHSSPPVELPGSPPFAMVSPVRPARPSAARSKLPFKAPIPRILSSPVETPPSPPRYIPPPRPLAPPSPPIEILASPPPPPTRAPARPKATASQRGPTAPSILQPPPPLPKRREDDEVELIEVSSSPIEIIEVVEMLPPPMPAKPRPKVKVSSSAAASNSQRMPPPSLPSPTAAGKKGKQKLAQTPCMLECILPLVEQSC